MPQELYEQIRPFVLFHETAGELAKAIDIPQRTLSRNADEFERDGMQSLFSSREQGAARETGKTLPEEVRQLIVDLHSELPSMSWREIAEVCYIRYGRKPDHKNVKRIATATPLPSLQALSALAPDRRPGRAQTCCDRTACGWLVDHLYC
jgi:hypothetical protein